MASLLLLTPEYITCPSAQFWSIKGVDTHLAGKIRNDVFDGLPTFAISLLPQINHKFEMHLVSKLKMQGIKTININPGELLMEMQSMYFTSTCKSYSEMFTILQIKYRKKSTNQHSTISLTKLSMNT